MDVDEKVIRQLEDFILHERKLKSVGNLPFQHNGEERLAYPYIRASNGPLVAALRGLQHHLDTPPAEIQFLEVGCGIGTKCELARGLGRTCVVTDKIRCDFDCDPDVKVACQDAWRPGIIST